jgi:hypothetical protein
MPLRPRFRWIAKSNRDASDGKAGRSAKHKGRTCPNARAASQETCLRVSPISRAGRAEERMIVAATMQSELELVVRPLRVRISKIN